MKRLWFTLLILFTAVFTYAQRNEIVKQSIHTVQVVAGENWLSMPIIELHGDDPIHISFDDLTHEYARYAYKIEHCEADWSITQDLFDSDFCAGFADGNIIDDVTESINTNIIYTHYHLQLPNENCKPKLSGNYRLTVYDENTKEIAFYAYFMVVETAVSLHLEATTNTDVDVNGAHQQVAMSLDYGNLRVINPQKEIKTIVLQNGSWPTAVYNPTPQYTMSNGLRWEHNRQLIFNGGNEYRKFETLDVTHTTMGLESVGWDGKDFHAYVWPDEPRPNYLYDEDANGAFYIRNSDNIENDYGSQYLYVHFQLISPRKPYPIYLNAVWTNEQFTPDYEMQYDEMSKCYTKTLLLKQGYYSYRYLILDANGVALPQPTEGNFSQTENSYQCLVYYRRTGQRTDLLVGFVETTLN